MAVNEIEYVDKLVIFIKNALHEKMRSTYIHTVDDRRICLINEILRELRSS